MKYEEATLSYINKALLKKFFKWQNKEYIMNFFSFHCFSHMREKLMLFLNPFTIVFSRGHNKEH